MSTTGVQHDVRAARSGDARGIVRLLESIYDEDRWFVGDGPPRADMLARRIRGESDRSVLFLVATEGEHVVGWLELQRLAPEKLHHVAVLTIAVEQAHRRRGLGTKLLRRSYAWAERVGVLKISLSVRANNRAAIELYEREEFVHEGREERHIRTPNGFEANVIMARFME
jgi:ribosomal protein S18 acetylase RimI-like enzyme